ncbi:helix-turn-helix domain-containing protein [Burkholderia stagnalis]|uniref:helix-turn-helix domain-containing protein n=1 Tax=Burkholderia stagnalis TaxID=1503054 RepID=UPI000A7AAB0E|nr:helix-turn-helix transcriptional regulator [Burkholderia stagnalis]
MSPLKKRRLAAGLTQAEVAKAVDVSQPSYQRWESGNTPVPAGKLKKLARVLQTSVDEILGKAVPFDLFGIEKGVPDDRTFFGEIAVHFRTGGILLPISEAARSNVLQQLFENRKFMVIESLDNRIVFVRCQAVADIYFSSEAYDTYGPEEYEDHLGILPEDDFWKIIEHREMPEFLDGEVDAQRISEVLANIDLSDEALDDLVKVGEIAEGEREQARIDLNERVNELFERATTISWQLSSGKQRREYIGDAKDVFLTLNLLEEDGGFDSMICLPLEGYHRTIYVSPRELDYLYVPKHRYREAELEVLEELDGKLNF